MTSRSSSPSISLAARTFGLLALALTLFGLGGACEDKHVGRPCELGTVPLVAPAARSPRCRRPRWSARAALCLLPGAGSPLVGADRGGRVGHRRDLWRLRGERRL